MHTVWFVLITLLWIAFVAALIARPSTFNDSWQRFRGLSLMPQVLGWIVFLPWAAAAAVWESNWAVILRGVVVGGLAVATIYAFSPWAQ